MNDRVIWFCCFALLFIGMIVGININACSMTLDALYKVFGIIAGIGTLLTAIIASAALHTWMHQFSHAERFKAFKELEVIGFDCIGAIEKYWGVYKDEHFPAKTPCHYKDHELARSESLEIFWESKERYRIGVDFVQSLLLTEEIQYFEFSYSNFDTKVHEIISDIANAYEQDGEVRHKALCHVERNILNLKLDFKKNLRKFRGR
ncbi:hypothetical protein Sbal625DRAFT_3847 [Shewanella baltica OS625]|nr:hypothetical protein [Shewanella baltica]ADT92665.1 hypothetical protein Sbal678_0466 [Shewanella baltica OS678]EHC04568.1 hypothetical protein Sbal625DRAFT_3847 [Shewanella baltica OS625]MCS6260924.1 hypothetical protein [Shewanella baltica]